MEEMHGRPRGKAEPLSSGGGGGGGDPEQVKALQDQVAELEADLDGLKAQAKRLPSLSPSALIQLDKLDNR